MGASCLMFLEEASTRTGMLWCTRFFSQCSMVSKPSARVFENRSKIGWVGKVVEIMRVSIVIRRNNGLLIKKNGCK
jgi:hypothetical protein